MNIIEISNLEKSYKEVKAVNNISFDVKEGELFAFLGINGAGKSTTISMICGNLKKDAGKIYIDGQDIDRASKELKSKIGVVFQETALDLQLSVYDNLKSRAALYDITGDAFKTRLNELVTLFELDEIIKRPLNKLSGGQKRRVDIARAIIHQPKILILDEPTTGLDPKTRKMIWHIIENLQKEENLTVFLTTHYMEEAANASHIVIINKGEIVAKGTPLELKNQYVKDYVNLYNINETEIKKLGIDYKNIEDGYRVYIDNTEIVKECIIKYPEVFNDFEVIKGNMDDVFLNVTGLSLEEQ